MALKPGQPRRPTSNTASPANIPLKDQVAIVKHAAAQNGIPFWTLWGIYGAESTWGKNGGNWFGLTSVPRSHPLTFEGDANISAATVKRLLKGNTMENALRAYSGGSYGVDHILQLGNQMTTPGSSKGPLAAAKKAGHDLNPFNAIGTIEDAVKAIATFVVTILNPSEWGKLLANTIATLLRLIVKAIYDYTILPPWHWTERATDYYWKNNMAATTLEAQGRIDSSQNAADRWNRQLITIGFWGLGYFLLWGKADQDEVALSGNTPQKTVLGRNIQTIISAKGRKGLKKGKKEIDKATPPKPAPHNSSAPINHVRTVQANRRRTVTVSGVTTHTGPGRYDSTEREKAPDIYREIEDQDRMRQGPHSAVQRGQFGSSTH